MKTLPDYLRKGMKLIIVGCNPTESSVRVGHYYAGRTNQFWNILFDSGVIPEPFDYHDDKRVIEFAIGLTDLVKRPTKTIEELTREDFAEGRIVLSQKLEEFAPRVVAFNGKLTYEQFSQRKCKYGLQKQLLYGARVYVLPSTATAQHDKGNSEHKAHFKKLAQLVSRTQQDRESPVAVPV
jgi:double-stranded uracil-DNA glycosylase